MPAVSGMLDTYDTPNYVGELFFTTPRETPFLSMIGGLTGGLRTDSKSFAWQTSDNASATQPAVVEGADTVYSGRSRAQAVNVVQIHQEGIKVSYTKMGATGNISGASILGNQPVKDELSFQRELKLQKVGRDIEYSFLQGTYTADTDISTARGTRGLSSAITTNAVAAAGAALTQAHLQSLWRAMADNGAQWNNLVVFANSLQRQRITEIYGLAPDSRSVGGMSINQIVTDFGEVGIVYNRFMPTGSIFAVDVSVCAPVFLEIPGKGTLFAEPLPAAGAYEQWQLYCEVGLHYGPENWHGKITGLATV